jgi:hypothetical protein
MESTFAVLAEALHGEIDQLNSLQRNVVLCEGECRGTFAGWTYYRFEAPEEIFFRPVEHAVFTFGQKHSFQIPGTIIETDNQFITVALPQDFGPVIPEIRCVLQYENEIRPILNILSGPDCKTPLTSFLLNPNSSENMHFVGFEQPHFPENTPPHQCDAVRKIFDNRVTMLWGPISSGKTHIVALAAANYLLMGKSVLIAAPANDYIDAAFLKTISHGISLGLPMEKIACRFGLPSAGFFKEVMPYSFSHQREQLKNEKRNIFQERTTLLRTYWNVRKQEALHEDFYLKIQSLRALLGDARRQAEQIGEEITQWTAVIGSKGNASFLERVKSGFSNEELIEAQQKLASCQQRLKQIRSFEQTVTNDITAAELEAPISAEEWKHYREAHKRIDELGGVETVTQSVEQFIAVDEKALLESKQLTAASTAALFTDTALRGRRYDMIVLEEAQRVDMPTLVALASLAKEKFIAAGDPFQVESDSITNTKAAQRWLQTDVFLHAANTKELHRLFDWSKENQQWSIQLQTHYASAPKISEFMASVLYDNTIGVIPPANPKGKIYFIDTSGLGSACKQYAGKKRISPYNEQQTKIVLDCIIHALLDEHRSADEIGVIVPFVGPTLYTKLKARIFGMRNIEIGTPQSFCDRRKPAIIFDTTMAGVDYTMRSLDDKKVGEHKIIKLLNTILSCASEDLYIIADMTHFRTVYKDRLITRLLILLQASADALQPSFASVKKKYDALGIEQYAELFSNGKRNIHTPPPEKSAPIEEDHELAIHMKMMSAKKSGGQSHPHTGTVEKDTYNAVCRSLGYRFDINLLSQFIGGSTLMKSSFSSLMAARRLPFYACENEKTFRSALEQWNLLLYTLTGNANPESSFFSEKTPEARIRFDIHQIHTFFSSDIEMILQDGKQKRASEISRIFQEMIGKNQPGTPGEWSAAYICLLSRIETYLAWISEQIRR